MDRQKVLKSSVLFKDWDAVDLKNLSVLCQEHVLTRGQAVFYEGEDPKSLFIIGAGAASVKKAANSGDDQNVAQFGKENHFGEMGLFAQNKRSATIEMSEGGEVLEVPYEALEKIIQSSPVTGVKFYKSLAQTLASRISRTTEDLAGIRSLRLKHT